MKKNIYKLFIFATLLTLSACSSDEAVDSVVKANEDEKLVSMTFTASQEGDGGTRAHVGIVDASAKKTSIYWTSQDEISIFDATGNGGNQKFQLSSGENTKNCSFAGSANDANTYTAVYPYTSEAVLNNDGSVSNVVLPSTQTATDDSFDPKAALMMAVSTPENKMSLAFKNVVGYVKVSPTFACSKIIIRPSDKNAFLAGKGKLQYNDGEPIIDFSESNEKSYIVSLVGDIKANTDYYIAVPAATLSANWSITFVSDDNKVYIRQSNNSIEFKRKTVKDLGTFEEDGPYWVTGASGIVKSDQEIDLNLQITINGEQYKVIFAKSNLTALGLATNDYDLGDYFAWGATEPWLMDYTTTGTSPYLTPLLWAVGKREGYTYDNAPYWDGTKFTKYEVTDETLDLSEDAARVILGGNWQMPPKEIIDALKDHCTFVTNNNIKGCSFSNSTSNSIFFPTAGFVSTLSPGKIQQGGNYWTNAMYYDEVEFTNRVAKAFRFYVPGATTGDNNTVPDGVIFHPSNLYSTRNLGMSIRPVRLEKIYSSE